MQELSDERLKAEAPEIDQGSDEGISERLPLGLQKIVSQIPVDHFGTSVHLRGWRLEKSENHPVLIVHDLGEQAGHYQAAAEAFLAHGYSTYAFDLRGHGRSGRRLGHASSFTVLVRDLLQVAAWVRHKEGGRAPIIIGHGIGALIVIEFTKSHGKLCKGAILSAPLLELTVEVSPLGRLVLKLLAELSPTIRIPDLLCPRFARDLKTRRSAGSDGSGFFPRLTAIFAHELLQAIRRIEARFIEYQGQVLILCPGKDTISHYGQLKKSAALHNEHNLQIADLTEIGHHVFTGSKAARTAALDVIVPWLERVRTSGQDSGASREDVRIGGATRGPEAAIKPGATRE